MRFVAVLLLFACASEPEAKVAEAPTGEPARFAPHYGTIVRTAITADGTAAVSVDDQRQVRLWGALDGSMEPVVVPIVGAKAMAVARRPSGALVVALQDDAGAGRAFVFAPDGGFVEVIEYLSDVSWLDVELHPTGEHFVSLGADHALRLHDLGGRELARYEAPSFSPTTLDMSEDGRRIATTNWTEQRTLTEITTFEVDVVHRAIRSLDQRKIAHDQVVPPELAPSLEKAVAIVPTRSHVEVLELSTGHSTRMGVELSGSVSSASLITDDTVVVGLQKVMLVVPLDGQQRRVYRGFVAPRSHARGGGRMVAGRHGWLVAQTPTEGAPLYLGHAPIAPTNVTLSPSGRTVAWLDSGRTVVAPVDGGPRVVPGAGNAMAFELLDDEHMAAMFVDGARIVRIDDGAVVHEIPGPTGSAIMTFYPRARILGVKVGTTTHFVQLDDDLVPRAVAVLPQSANDGIVDRPGAPSVWTHNGLEVYRQPLHDVAEGVPLRLPERYSNLLHIDATGVVHRRNHGGAGVEIVAERGEDLPPTVIPSVAAQSVHVSRWGRTYVAIGPSAMGVYDARTGRLRYELGGAFIGGRIAWSADGTRFAAVGSASVLVADAFTGAVVFGRCAGEFRAGRSEPNNLATGVTRSATTCRLATTGR